MGDRQVISSWKLEEPWLGWLDHALSWDFQLQLENPQWQFTTI